MVVWYRGTQLEHKYRTRLRLTEHIESLGKLRNDESIPLLACPSSPARLAATCTSSVWIDRAFHSQPRGYDAQVLTILCINGPFPSVADGTDRTRGQQLPGIFMRR